MSALLYGVGLQWKLDMRSKTLLISCYAVPLLFFAVMGGIFTTVNPTAKDTLIQSMTVLGVSMGALIGLPPSLVEIYGSDIKKMYKANGVPLYLGLVTTVLSAFVHLLIMSVILFLVAPLAFDAAFPARPLSYFGSLALFIAVSLSVGSVLGLLMKSQSKLTMISQLFFLPSIMLSGIMFPVEMLPGFLETAGKLFPASWGFLLMTGSGNPAGSLLPLLAILAAAALVCGLLLKKLRSK